MRSYRGGLKTLSGSASSLGVFEEEILPQLDGLYGAALRLTGDPDAAADLLQDTVLRAFQKFHQLRRHGAARAWLVRILTTTFLNRYARQPQTEELTASDEPVFVDTPEAAMLRRCDAEEVEEALAGLREEFRLVVLLADVEELSLREIAEITHCPVGTVASRLARGRRRLRARLRHLGRAGEGEA